MFLDLTQIGMPSLVNTFLKGIGGGVGIWEKDRKELSVGILYWGSVEGSGFQDTSKERKLVSCYSNSLSSEVFRLVFEP